MSNRQVPTTPEGKFGQDIVRLVQELIREQRFVIPNLTADPPETDPTNLWMRYDGRLRGRYWNGSGYTYVDYPMRSDITSPPAVPAYPSAPTAPSAPQSYTKTWTSTWSQTYQGDATKRTDTIGEAQLSFGTDSDAPGYGYQVALAGFDYADLVSQLASSTIQSMSVTFTTLNSYFASGTTVSLGMHNQTAEPTTYTDTSTILRRRAEADALPGSTRAYPVPIAFAQQLRSGTAKGLVFETPNADPGYHGVVAGVGSGYTPPQLTITYAK